MAGKEKVVTLHSTEKSFRKLKLFFNFGHTDAYYRPTLSFHKDENAFLTLDRYLIAIMECVEADKLLDVCNMMLKVYSDGYSINPKFLIAGLSACIQKDSSISRSLNGQVRDAAYKAAKIICSSNENFLKLLYFSHAKGQPFKRFVKDWYWSKDVKTLGEIVGKNKKLFRISHKRIVKRSHLKPNGPGMAAIFKYLLFGIKAAKKEFEENAEANDVLNYLQLVEDLRHMKDEQKAARYIEMYHFTLDHVPSHLLKSKEVWSALIGNLPLPVLLKNLQRMGSKGFLQPNSVLVNKVIDALNDETAIAESQIHPSHVYMELRNYECSSKILAEEKRKLRYSGSPEYVEFMGKPKRGRPVANPKIMTALYDLFATTCKLCLAPTGLRYFVTIDLKNLKSTDLCHGCLCVSPTQASILISLCLLHADQNVAINTCNENQELVPLPLTRETTIQEGIKMLKEVRMKRVEITTPIDWALKNKQEHDVFVLLTDSILNRNNIDATLLKYREEMNIPNAKFVVVIFKHKFAAEWLNPLTPGIFLVRGFDRHVPRLIEGFCRGAY